jgi:hypothetical protein
VRNAEFLQELKQPGWGAEAIKPGGRVAQVFIQAPGMGCFLYL